MYDYEKKDVLAEDDKGVRTARNVLARLFRQILRDRKINHARWHMLMHRYLHDPRNKIPPNGKDKSSARGNLNKELRRDRMTFKVFYDKAIPFLNPRKVTFTLTCEWEDGKTTIHSAELDRRLLQSQGIDPETVGWGSESED